MRAALLALVMLLGPRDLSRPGVGDAAPVLEVETVDGRPFGHGRLGGTVTVVDFFATWCKPCHRALQDLAAIKGTLGPRVRLVLVDVGEDAATVRRFLAANPAPEGAEVVLDRSGGTGRRWGQEGFPTTFLVDDGGVIRHINRGWGAGYQGRLLRWLRAMMTAPEITPVRHDAGGGKAPPREVVKGVEILRGG